MVKSSYRNPYIFWKKQAEGDLSEVDQLKAQVALLSQFVADQDELLQALTIVARNPLTLLKDPVMRINEGAVNADDLKLVEEQAVAFERLFNLVQSQREVYKLLQRDTKKRIDVAAISTSARLQFIGVAEVQDIAIAYKASRDTPYIKSDPLVVQRIVIALLAKAIAYTESGGKIQMVLAPAEDSEDYAVSISLKYKGEKVERTSDDMITRLEVQLSKSGPVNFDLVDVRLLVGMLGGRFEIEADPGFSTTFKVLLPAEHNLPHLPRQLSDERDDDIDRDSDQEEVTPASELTLVDTTDIYQEDKEALILLVEDNTDVRYYLRSCLEPQYHVLEAANGLDGLRIAEEHMPDLIVADVMMPVMDGHTLCKQVKEDERLNHIPVVLATALSADEYRLKGFEVEADAYLVKPFDSRVLLGQIKTLLVNRSRLQKYFSDTIMVEPTGITVPSVDRAFIDHARRIVEEQMHQVTFDLHQFAEYLHMGPRQLQRKFKAVLGMTPTAYVRTMRLKRAAQLLQQRAGNVSQIAYQVGYSHPRHFTRNFKKEYGRSPSNYMAEFH